MIDRLGRALLAGMFVVGGVDSVLAPGARVQVLIDARVPRPAVVAHANGALLVGGGVALAVGVRPRLTALLLSSSLVPMTIVGHPFWKRQGAGRKADVMGFARNVSLLGGLLLSASRSTGR